ncbi:hypothetical protein [Sediminihabitans luteus]|uniref:hypothetical protein n=1 Tax=Sediminihabitans luteus TaxID=1138585 RepID=UPI0012FD436B|nr:hypothetical protein [Sediminihabitans luteus]
MTSLNVTPPAGAAVGDLLIFTVFCSDPAATTVTPPAGVATVLARTTVGTRVGYIFAVTHTAVSSYTFTMSSAVSIHVATSVIRTTASPAAITVGTVWKRASSTTSNKAPSINVVTAGSLALAFMLEASNTGEKETDVSPTGLPRWFFSRQATAIESIQAQYVDNAPVGLTSEANATYLNAASSGIGVQIVVPPAPAGAVAPPTAAYATITAQTYNSLRIGAKVTDADTVTATAVPVGGGATVGASPVVPSASGWVSVKLVGLNAGVEYDVTLTSAGVALTTVSGSTLTPQRSSFVVVTGSCQGNATDPVVFNQMATDNADFFVHQGDLHYRDTQDETTWRAGVDMALATARMKAFIASTPMFYRWDNHDWGGSLTWRDSPVSAFAPSAIRELFGSDFPHPKALYQTFTHRGVRFVDTDQWTLRDEALTTPSSDGAPGKSMWSIEQREWFFDTLTSSTEALIVWFTSFPLYSNRIGGGRWGNYLEEISVIENFFDTHPEIRARIVAVGGDSHSVCADDGASAMWHVPSLNASPFSQSGGLASGAWNIANLDVPDDRGYYSRLSFDWTGPDELGFTWEAVQDDGDVVATWSNTYPREWEDPWTHADGTGPAVIVDGVETPATWTIIQDGVEVPVTSWSVMRDGVESPIA